jgi:hypothetical protein
MAHRLTFKTQREEAYETICDCQALIRRPLRSCYATSLSAPDGRGIRRVFKYLKVSDAPPTTMA